MPNSARPPEPPRRPTRALRYCRRGVETVEFALISAAVIGLLLFAVEVCWQTATAMALEYGARTAARFGQTGSCTLPQGMNATKNATRISLVAQVALQSTGNFFNPNNLTVYANSFPSFSGVQNPPDTASILKGNTGNGAGTGSQTVQYVFIYKQPYLSGFPIAGLQQMAMTHTASFVLQNDPFPAPGCP